MIGSLDRRRERPNVIVDEVLPLAFAAERLTQAVRIAIPASPQAAAMFTAVQQTLQRHQGGSCPVQIEFQSSPEDPTWIVMDIDRALYVKPSAALCQDLDGGIDQLLPADIFGRLASLRLLRRF